MFWAHAALRNIFIEKCGFNFVEAKNMYYNDTGWTEYKLFELNM